MAAHRFRAGSKRPETFPIEIEAVFLDPHKDVEVSEFTFMPVVPGGLLMEVAAQTNENGDPLPGALLHLLESAVVPEDQPRLVSLLRSKDPYVHVDTLNELFKWLQERYAKRPTATRSGSSAGQRSSGPISMAAGSDRDEEN
jgi:hypothetical protein